MKVFFDQHIGVFEDAISKDYCEKLLQIFKNNIDSANNRNEQYGNMYKEDDFTIPPIKMEDLSLHPDTINQELRDKFAKEFFDNIFPLYWSKYKLEEVITSNIHLDDFKVQRTLPTEGFHVWHAESCFNDPRVVRRLMVWTLYLNDVEEGGETEFLLQSKRIKPKQGTVCIFPGGYTHVHRGNPPLSGEKYIVTGWVSFHQDQQK